MLCLRAASVTAMMPLPAAAICCYAAAALLPQRRCAICARSDAPIRLIHARTNAPAASASAALPLPALLLLITRVSRCGHCAADEPADSWRAVLKSAAADDAVAAEDSAADERIRRCCAGFEPEMLPPCCCCAAAERDAPRRCAVAPLDAHAATLLPSCRHSR